MINFYYQHAYGILIIQIIEKSNQINILINNFHIESQSLVILKVPNSVLPKYSSLRMEVNVDFIYFQTQVVVCLWLHVAFKKIYPS